MSLWISLLAAAAIVLTSSVAYAQETRDDRRQAENFYLTFGMGASMNSYPAETTRDLETFYGRSSSGRPSFSIELGGLWPVMSGRTLLGAMVSVTGESTESDGTQSDFTLVGVGASLRHYLMANPGDGIYLRGDVGAARASVSHESTGTSGVRGERSSDGNLGVALLVGAGYALPIGSGTSLSVDASYTWRSLPGYRTGTGATSSEPFEEGTYSSATLMVSILW